MSSLGTWVKSLVHEPQIPQKDPSHAISESLLAELDCVIKEMEAEKREEESEERKRKSGVDYSWLRCAPTKSYEMPQLERLELEELSMRVSPGECGRVLTMFRDAVEARDPEIHEVPKLLRTVIFQVIEGRPKEDTMSEWMMKSLSNLSKYRPKSSKRIMPLTLPDSDYSSQEPSSPSTSGNIFVTSNSSTTLVQSIEQLPV